MTKYLHDWEQGGKEAMLSDFGITEDALNGAKVIVASYTYETYSGDAYVLFEREGKLWEVHGGHCSCYGLSESDYYGGNQTQWQPEETTKEAVLARMVGTWGEEGKVREYVVAALKDNPNQ